MQALVSLIFAAVPIFLYLWGIWLMDRYDREPLGLLALNFAWGATGAIALSLAASRVAVSLFSPDTQQLRVGIAPVIEEFAKGVFLLWTARRRSFDNITDGVVYGMAIGFGFGMAENFLYFLHATSAGEWAQRVILRTLYTALMHAMAAGMFGAFVGLAKFELRRLRVPLGFAGIAAAIGMHAAWNYWASISQAEAGVVDGVFIGLSLLVILVIMQISLFLENRLILRELTDEAESGRIPAVHLEYLPYSSRRRMLGWLPPSIDRRTYVQLATRLAFRKAQQRAVSGADRDAYAEEVAAVRAEIASLLDRESASPAARLF